MEIASKNKNMLDIPYISNPGKACALACYTMTAKYFFPEITFEQVAKISEWESDSVIWPFKFWLWIMNKGINVVDYDLIDLQKWADEGIEGLRKSVSEKEFNYYLENTKKLESYGSDIKKVINHPNFTYNRKRPEFSDLEVAFKNGAVCEVVLNSSILDGGNEFEMHRVVVLDLTEKEIIFHDPRKKVSRPARKETKKLFEKAWLSLNEPELCVYSRKRLE